MKNSTKYIIMGSLIFGLGTLLYLVGGSGGNDQNLEGKMVDSINWEKNYDSESRHPYGTYFVRQILSRGLDDHQVEDINVSIQTYFDSTNQKVKGNNATYFYVGKSLNLFNSEVDSLLDFVSKGNTMFVAAQYLPVKLLEELFRNYDSHSYFDYSEDSIVSLNYIDENFSGKFKLQNEVRKKLQSKRWRYINYGIDFNYNGTKLGEMDGRPCYMKFYYGSGTVLIHTAPQAFTNNFLKTNEGREYVEIALSYFPKSTILFDNYTQFVYDDGRMEIDYGKPNDYSRDGTRIGGMNTLKFLLETPTFRWGYLLIVLGLVLFAIFRGKRQQKIIPTMESNDNSSLEFTETIARLYLTQNQHNKLTVHMKNIFINKMKTMYYIAYSDEPKYAEKISKKSGVDLKEVKTLLKLFKGGVNMKNLSDEYLINLYKKLNDFYKKAR